jgi:hypothetical protein
MLAEAAGLGMLAGGIEVPYRTEADAATMARYFEFFRAHADVFSASNGRTVSDVLLVFPKTQIDAAAAESLEMLEVAGRTMVIDHVQFDFVPDELLPTVALGDYRAIVAAEPFRFEAADLESFHERGGRVVAVPRTVAKAADPAWKKLQAEVVPPLEPHSGGKEGAEPFRKALLAALGQGRATIDAPETVEVHRYRQPRREFVHLVNYDHREGAGGTSNVEREAPIATAPVDVDLPLAKDHQVRRVTFLDPDAESSRSLPFRAESGRLRFQTPQFLVYGVCVIEFQ